MNKRIIIAALVGVIIALSGYYFFGKNTSQTASDIQDPTLESDDTEGSEDADNSADSGGYDPSSDIKLSEEEKVASVKHKGVVPDRCANFNLDTNNKLVSGFFDNDKVKDSVVLEWIDNKTGELTIKTSKVSNYKQFIFSRGPAKYVTLIPVAKGEELLTSCGDGYKECAKDDPAEIKLKHDGFIEYNCLLDSSYLYEWNSKANKLKVTPLGKNSENE